jgi:hypothetical protein
LDIFSRFWRRKPSDPAAATAGEGATDLTFSNQTMTNVGLPQRGSSGQDRNWILSRERVEGGVDLRGLVAGAVVEARTKNSVYEIRIGEQGRILLAGHAEHCPTPTEVVSVGSVLLTGAVCDGYLAPGMRMEFRVGERRVFTSRLTGVAVIATGGA